MQQSNKAETARSARLSRASAPSRKDDEQTTSVLPRASEPASQRKSTSMKEPTAQKSKSPSVPQRIQVQQIPKGPARKPNPNAQSWIIQALQIFSTEFNRQDAADEDFNPSVREPQQSTPRVNQSGRGFDGQRTKRSGPVAAADSDATGRSGGCYEPKKRDSSEAEDDECVYEERNKFDFFLDVVTGGDNIPGNLCECSDPNRYISEDDNDMVWEAINYLADEATRGAKVVGTFLKDRITNMPSLMKGGDKAPVMDIAKPRTSVDKNEKAPVLDIAKPRTSVDKNEKAPVLDIAKPRTSVDKKEKQVAQPPPPEVEVVESVQLVEPEDIPVEMVESEPNRNIEDPEYPEEVEGEDAIRGEEEEN